MLSHKDYSFFHSCAWAKLIYESYGYKPHYIFFESSAGVEAVLPFFLVESFVTGKRAVSLPFTDYLEPLVFDSKLNSQIVEHTLNYFRPLNLKYIEFRGGEGIFPGIEASDFFYRHILKLNTDTEKLFASFSGNTKRNIKKAQKENVSIERSSSSDAMNVFYELNCVTRKKHGLPPQPKKFFEKFLSEIISQRKGFISLARYEGRDIAGAVFLHFGKKAVYKFGASLSEFQQLRANNAIMWDAISYYNNEGFDSFCFGRTEPNNDGLRQFKNGWGVEESIWKTFRYDCRSNNFVKSTLKTSGFHNKIFSRMPLPLLKLTGNILYKHIA
jgi:hypothetical protein